MTPGRSWCAACIVLSLLAAAPASAQSTRRPDLNPFGRGFRDASQSLSVNGNLGATFYDVIERQTVRQDGQEIPDRGWGSFASASLGYRLSFPSVSFEGSVGVVGSYYPQIGPTVRTQVLPGAGARFGWSWDLTDRTQLSLGSGVSYRPAYAESLLTGGVGGGRGGGQSGRDPGSAFLPPESLFVGGSYLSSANDAALRHQVSRRWSATADYGYQHSFAFGGGDETEGGGTRFRRRDGWTQRGGTALHFAVARNLSVRGGYRYSESHFGDDGEVFRRHSADIGVNFGDRASLQLTRQTTLSFGGGVSGFVSQQGRQRYRLTGDVALTHEIGRTWSSSLAYSRGVSTDELLFEEPVLRDTLTASLNGLVSRRVGFHATARASHGAVGFLDRDSSHTSIVASTGLQTALTQHVAVSVDYAYYQYRFDDDLARPAGLSDRSASQGVHAYLSLWAPIFQSRGRMNASR